MKKVALWLIPIGIILLLLVLLEIWLLELKKPSPGTSCDGPWLWDSSCLFFQEKFYDKTLSSPSGIHPVLTSFVYAQGGGNSIYLPCWYRFRYVNVNTGGYSDFSDWTPAAVMSGSCCLPCPKGVGNCPSSVKKGYDGCTANQPTIGVPENQAHYDPTKPRPDGDFIFMNLHRYVGDTPQEDDQIVGYLKPGGVVDGVRYFDWTDILFNPCSQGCETPSTCQSSKPCGKCLDVLQE